MGSTSLKCTKKIVKFGVNAMHVSESTLSHLRYVVPQRKDLIATQGGSLASPANPLWMLFRMLAPNLQMPETYVSKIGIHYARDRPRSRKMISDGFY